MSRPSAWTERFLGLQDPTEIRRRSIHIPTPLKGLTGVPTEVACNALERSFKVLFVPTEQTDAILQELIEMAIAHSVTAYPNSKTFMAGTYAKICPLQDAVTPICLTGPAGVGKSHLLSALRRLLPPDNDVLADPDHPKFPLISSWSLNVRDKTSLSGIFLHLLLGDENIEADESIESKKNSEKHTQKNRKDIPALLRRSRRIAFKSGVSLLLADEFQFATRSEAANTLVTSMLLHLSAIGIPMVYVANYSLGHRLKNRPQEDRQRLLSRPLVLLPDAASSADWGRTLSAYQQVAPDIFKFNVEKDSHVIHGWTGGLKRLLGKLLCEAYRRSRNTGGLVTIAEIESAYKSVKFSMDRTDINLMNQQLLTGVCARKDLWCPFELPMSTNAIQIKQVQDQRIYKTGEELVKGAMFREERDAYNELQKAASTVTGSAKGKVLKMKRKGGLSTEDLRQGENVFRGSLD